MLESIGACPKLVKNMFGKLGHARQSPLSDVLLQWRRHFQLSGVFSTVSSVVVDLENFCIAQIEVALMPGGCAHHVLSEEPSKGANLQYTYAKGRSTTWRDPRSKVRPVMNRSTSAPGLRGSIYIVHDFRGCILRRLVGTSPPGPKSDSNFSQVFMSTSDLSSAPKAAFRKQVALYLTRASRTTRAAFDKYNCLSIVGDEARCSNTQLLASFISAPVDEDRAFGFVAPFQMSPDLHVDFEEKELPVRIEEAFENDGKAPRSDDLVSTWHCCRCLDNTLKSSFGDDLGLMHFQAEEWRRPGHPLSIAHARQHGCSSSLSAH